MPDRVVPQTLNQAKKMLAAESLSKLQESRRADTLAELLQESVAKNRDREAAAKALPFRSVSVVVNDSTGRPISHQVFMLNEGDVLDAKVDDSGDVIASVTASPR